MITYLEILGKVFALEDHNAAMVQRQDNLGRSVRSAVIWQPRPGIVDTQTGPHQSSDLREISPIVGSCDDLTEVGVLVDMLLQSDANFCLASQ